MEQPKLRSSLILVIFYLPGALVLATLAFLGWFYGCQLLFDWLQIEQIGHWLEYNLPLTFGACLFTIVLILWFFWPIILGAVGFLVVKLVAQRWFQRPRSILTS